MSRFKIAALLVSALGVIFLLYGVFVMVPKQQKEREAQNVQKAEEVRKIEVKQEVERAARKVEREQKKNIKLTRDGQSVHIYVSEAGSFPKHINEHTVMIKGRSVGNFDDPGATAGGAVSFTMKNEGKEFVTLVFSLDTGIGMGILRGKKVLLSSDDRTNNVSIAMFSEQELYIELLPKTKDKEKDDK